ncbi:hypothetical protein EDB19DRAFT_1835753 [Suillus lakei]|nr:hypothetical protein EDB19DRAFT_1835753 [Suillus lakei]
MHFKAGLQWEITYSAARNIISVIPNPVAHILQLFPQLAWNIVPDHVFSSHLCSGDPSRIISSYDTPWWIGHTAIPNELWQWDRVFACCIQSLPALAIWQLRMMVSFFPEQVDETSGPTLLALKWMRERLRTLVEEQQEGIREKMGEIEVYTAILTRLKRGRGE